MKNVIKILSVSLLFFAIAGCDSKRSAENNTAEPETPKSTASLSSQEANATASAEKAPETFPVVEFEETEFDFGNIKEGDIVKHTFKFKNTGDLPYVISSINVTCGCTTPEYTKAPVAPGETGEILVQFNSKGKSGMQVKNVTVNSNVKGGRTILQIKTNVSKTEDLPGPFKVQ